MAIFYGTTGDDKLIICFTIALFYSIYQATELQR